MPVCAADPIQRPSLALLGAEPWRAAMDFARNRLARDRPAMLGDGHPVVIFPGLGAGARSVAGLRQHCRALGYQAFDWGQGLNTGPRGEPDRWLVELKTRMSALLSSHRQTATFIGWSLGGLYARELAKLMAPRVRQVITLGTPFNAEADHTHAGWLLQLLNPGTRAWDAAWSRRLRATPPMQTVSIYSRSDGVVAWQTCRHEENSGVGRDIEVDSSHLGMGWNREVLDAVADCLAKSSSTGGTHETAH